MRLLWSILTIFWFGLSGVAAADVITPSDDVRSVVIVREAPSTQSDRIGVLAPGEALELVSDATPRWYRVRLAGGRTGFVSRRWTVRVAAEEPQTEATTPLTPLSG